MNKIFKIASYDFKRLVLNPITSVVVVALLALSIIFGVVYKIEPTPEYKAEVSGTTAQIVYSNFINSHYNDSKSSLDAIFEEGNTYLIKLEDNIHTQTVDALNEGFNNVYLEIKKYHELETLGKAETYSGTDLSASNFKSATADLKNFVDEYALLEEFQTNVFFKNSDFEKLQEISAYFQTLSSSNLSSRMLLLTLYDNRSNFENLSTIFSNKIYWSIGQDKINMLQENYLTKSSAKMDKILEEMQNLIQSNDEDEDKMLGDMQNLITNYKLTAETAKFGVKYELLAMFADQSNNHYGGMETIYNITSMQKEEIELALVKMNYFLDDESSYYTQYQAPLNFNTASYQVTAYDHAYLITSIIGFITILFGIFCAYKLFGRDRRNGKMDLILSQNVTFGQVFVGKFLAIIFSTFILLMAFALVSLLFGLILHGTLPNSILAVFNLSSAYTISPILFFIIKFIGIELQVIFWATITVFLMNISRKFDLTFAIALVLFITATICNIAFNNSLVYCLFPFIHADLTAMLGGGTMQTGFLVTSVYAYGNFFISLTYYLVIVVLFFNFTKQLFKKN